MQVVHEPDAAEKGFTAANIGILFDTQRYDESVTDGQIELIDNFFESLKMSGLDVDTTGTPVAAVALPKVDFAPLMNLISTNNRFVYTGSMTSPPCSIKVYWNVINKVYPIKA